MNGRKEKGTIEIFYRNYKNISKNEERFGSKKEDTEKVDTLKVEVNPDVSGNALNYLEVNIRIVVLNIYKNF